jgi:hypothetical protein
MSLFNSQTFKIRRKAAGFINSKGRWEDGLDEDPIYATGTAQPTQGLAVKNMLEGKRISGLIEIITSSDLQVADPKTLIGGDEIEYDGEYWAIIYKAKWGNGILDHNEYIIAKPRELL